MVEVGRWVCFVLGIGDCTWSVRKLVGGTCFDDNLKGGPDCLMEFCGSLALISSFCNFTFFFAT